MSWTLPGFDDSSWTAGKTGVGYDNNPDYHPMIRLDLGTSMQNNNTTCYIRIPFQVDQPVLNTSFDFAMQFDDGFIAYINGTRVASRHAPADPTSTSVATADQSDPSAFNFQDTPFNEGTPTVVQGENILAVHGLNASIGSSDFLAVPRLDGFSVGDAGELESGSRLYFPQPTPGFGDVPGSPGISERPVFSKPTRWRPCGSRAT